MTQFAFIQIIFNHYYQNYVFRKSLFVREYNLFDRVFLAFFSQESLIFS